MTTRPRAPGLLAAGLIAASQPACLLVNPAFVLGAASDDGSGGSGGSSDGDTAGPVPDDTTAAATTDATGGLGQSTGPGDPSATTDPIATSAPGSTAADDTADDTGDPATTAQETDPGTTGEPEPQFLDLPADIAGCVLLPTGIVPLYADPDDCGQRVAQTYDYPGGVIVDSSFSDGGFGGGNGRPGRAYLRFVIPELPGATLLAAELTLQIADFEDAGGPSSGVLATTEPFDAEQLTQFPPPDGLDVVTELGQTADDESIVLQLPLDLLDPGAPLHLGIFPNDSDGVVFDGAGAPPDRRPKLRITYLE